MNLKERLLGFSGLNYICVKLGSLSDLLRRPIFKEKIIIRHHALKRIKQQRKIEKEHIFDCLINKNLKGILDQDFNKFKLYYENPQNPKYDLVIVVVIENNIKVITTYIQNVRKRVRTR